MMLKCDRGYSQVSCVDLDVSAAPVATLSGGSPSVHQRPHSRPLDTQQPGSLMTAKKPYSCPVAHQLSG